MKACAFRLSHVDIRSIPRAVLTLNKVRLNTRDANGIDCIRTLLECRKDTKMNLCFIRMYDEIAFLIIERNVLYLHSLGRIHGYLSDFHRNAERLFRDIFRLFTDDSLKGIRPREKKKGKHGKKDAGEKNHHDCHSFFMILQHPCHSFKNMFYLPCLHLFTSLFLCLYTQNIPMRRMLYSLFS